MRFNFHASWREPILDILDKNQGNIELLQIKLSLTYREAEVLHWVMLGKTNRDIGQILTVSNRTIDKHLQHIFQKMNVETRTRAICLAFDFYK